MQVQPYLTMLIEGNLEVHIIASEKSSLKLTKTVKHNQKVGVVSWASKYFLINNTNGKDKINIG
jgi:hypothetical protein